MVRLQDTTRTTTLFQFNSTDKLISNPESLFEEADFYTEEKKRYAMKSIIRRNTGLQNKRLHIKAVFSGVDRLTNCDSLIGVLSDNEFFYFDTEGHQSRLDDTYAPTGGIRQKEDKKKGTLTIDFDIIEQED